MNKQYLVKELYKIDKFILENGSRVPEQEWSSFRTTGFEMDNISSWEEMDHSNLQEAYDRGSYIQHNIIKNKY